MMVKLETLDEIKERILCVEKDVKQMKIRVNSFTPKLTI
jgi:hypothetical protein